MIKMIRRDSTPYPHRGIAMHSISVGGNFIGFVFAVGCVLMFVMALPEAIRGLALASMIAGVFGFGVIRLIRMLKGTD